MLDMPSYVYSRNLIFFVLKIFIYRRKFQTMFNNQKSHHKELRIRYVKN